MEKVTNMMRKLVANAVPVLVVSLTFGFSTAQAQDTPYQEPPAEICPISGSAAVSIDTDSNGNIYAAIQSTEDNGSIVKCSAAGALVWQIPFYDGPKNPPTENLRHESEGIGGLVVGADDSIYVTGDVYWGSNMHDCRTIKFNSDGDMIWTRQYDEISLNHPFEISGPDLCKDLDIDNTRGYIIVGGLAAGPRANDNYAGLLLKYDLDGVLLESRNNCSYALPCLIQYTDISISLYNGVVYALAKYDINTRSVRKLRSTDLTPIDGYGFPPGSTFIPTAIAADHKGNVIVGGSDMATIVNEETQLEEKHIYHKMALIWQPDGRMEAFCSSDAPGDDDLKNGYGCHLVGEIFYCPESGDSIWGMAILPDASKNHVVVTGSENLKSGSVIRTMVYHENCNPQWDSPMDYNAGGNTNRGRAIATDAEENLVIAGQSETRSVWAPTILKYGLKCESYTDSTSCWMAFSGCQWLDSAVSGICVEGH